MTPEHANEIIEDHKRHEQDKAIEETMKQTRDNLSHLGLSLDDVMQNIEDTYRAGLGLGPIK